MRCLGQQQAQAQQGRTGRALPGQIDAVKRRLHVEVNNLFRGTVGDYRPEGAALPSAERPLIGRARL